MKVIELGEFYASSSPARYAIIPTTPADSSALSAVVGITTSPPLPIYFDALSNTRKAQNLRRDQYGAFVVGWDNEQSLQLEAG